MAENGTETSLQTTKRRLEALMAHARNEVSVLNSRIEGMRKALDIIDDIEREEAAKRKQENMRPKPSHVPTDVED